MSPLRLFKDWKDVAEFRANATIFREKDVADAAYVILEGEVELTLRGEVLGVEKKGGVIGEMASIKSSTRNTTARAKTKLRLARMDRETLLDMISRHPDFAMHFMAVLANRLRAVDSYISTYLEQFADTD